MRLGRSPARNTTIYFYMDKLSYSWGLAMGQQLRGMGVKDLNIEDFTNAVRCVFENKEPEVKPEEAQQVINAYLQELEAKATKVAKEAGAKFLEENAKNEGVKVTASGLQYTVEKEGTGASPKATDEVTVHYVA